MAEIPKLNEANLQALCDTMADTGSGLTGSEIARYLAQCNIGDPIPGHDEASPAFRGAAAEAER